MEPWGKKRARATSERGAAAIELALAALVLTPLLFGVADMGLLWQKRQTVSSATRSGARTAASTCLIAANNPTSTCELGNRQTDDVAVLQSVLSVLKDSSKDVDRVIIYKAQATSGGPSDACKNTAVPGGVTDSCNVYGAVELRGTGGLSLATAKPTYGCGGFALFWCPTRRDRAASAVADIGVYIRLRHGHVTKLFGSGVVVEDHAVFRLEPNLSVRDDPAAVPFIPAAAPAPVPAPVPPPAPPVPAAPTPAAPTPAAPTPAAPTPAAPTPAAPTPAAPAPPAPTPPAPTPPAPTPPAPTPPAPTPPAPTPPAPTPAAPTPAAPAPAAPAPAAPAPAAPAPAAPAPAAPAPAAPAPAAPAPAAPAPAPARGSKLCC